MKTLEYFTGLGIVIDGIDNTDILQNPDDLLNVIPDYVNDDMKHSESLKNIENIIKSIYSHGFETFRNIQNISVKTIAEGQKDIIAMAQSGTGKTGAFTIGSLMRIDPLVKELQVIILAPTKELADQIFSVVKGLTVHTNIDIGCYRGGLTIHPKSGRTAQLIVGCPGRVKDLIEKGYITINNLKTLVLDEGDNLLDLGFRTDIEFIIKQLSDKVQLCVFSATMPNSILKICSGIMNKNVVSIIVPDNSVCATMIKQWYVMCNNVEEKDGCLIDLIETNKDKSIIIFFNSCIQLQRTSKLLNSLTESIRHLFIYGKMDQTERLESFTKFKQNECNVLLASDVAARGIDIEHISIVVNYDVPTKNETYIHRIGRSGRSNKIGNSILLINKKNELEVNRYKHLVEFYDAKINELESIIF